MRKAYSMALWAVTLAVVIAALAIIRVPLKRALESKVQATADYVFWLKWPIDGKKDTPKEYGQDTNSRAKMARERDVINEQIEESDGDIKVYTGVSSHDTSAFSGVAEGSEALLNKYDLND